MPLTDKHIKPKLTEKQQDDAFVWWCNKNEEELNIHFDKIKITDVGQMKIISRGMWLTKLEELGLRSCNS